MDFESPAGPLPRITYGNLVLGGLAAVEYTGRSIFLSQPELGALVAEYALDGRPLRTFGDLRKTGHEHDPGVHLAMNSGVVIANPTGGFYFVFLAGVPQFRKYDASGRLLFDRHIEGPELDELVQALPTTWARRRAGGRRAPDRDALWCGPRLPMLPAISGLRPQPGLPTCTTRAAKSSEPCGFAARARWLPPRCRSPRRGDCWLRPAATRSMSDGRAPAALTPAR